MGLKLLSPPPYYPEEENPKPPYTPPNQDPQASVTKSASLYYSPANQILSVYPGQPGRSSYFMEATSGRPDCIGCDASTPNKGPIPNGNYTLKAQELSDPNFLWDIFRNLAPIIGADWGDWRVPLTPDPGTDALGRTRLFLHGGSIKGTAGCIDVGGGLFGNASTDQLKDAIIKSPNGLIPLIVKCIANRKSYAPCSLVIRWPLLPKSPIKSLLFHPC